MFEGTFKYFLILFFIFLVVYFTKKISLYFLFKRTKEQPYKALIPFVATKSLIHLLDMKKSLFYFCLIPVANIFYYHQITKQLLSAFGQDPKEAILYTLFPMYKFPELAFKKPHFILNEYELTEGFIQSQNALFETKAEDLPDKIKLVDLRKEVDDYHANNLEIKPASYKQNLTEENMDEKYKDINSNEKIDLSQMNSSNQNNNLVSNENTNDVWNLSENQNISEDTINLNKEEVKPEENVGDSVFTNKSLEPDERHEKVVIAEKHEEAPKNPINPYNEGRPKLCPKCGAKLATDAKICFLCGTHLD